MDINERIRLLRKELGLNQNDFAQRIGLKQGAVSKFEQSGSTVTEQNVSMICKEFNVNKTWLLTGEGTMFTQEKEKADLVEWATRMSCEGDTFAHRLAVCVSKLTPEQLDTLADIAEKLVGETKAKKKGIRLSEFIRQRKQEHEQQLEQERQLERERQLAQEQAQKQAQEQAVVQAQAQVQQVQQEQEYHFQKQEEEQVVTVGIGSNDW